MNIFKVSKGYLGFFRDSFEDFQGIFRDSFGYFQKISRILWIFKRLSRCSAIFKGFLGILLRVSKGSVPSRFFFIFYFLNSFLFLNDPSH